MERVAHIFLHKVGIGKLVCFVLKTLFIIDPWEHVFCSDLRPEGVFFFVCWENCEQTRVIFFSLNNSWCCLSVFCYHTLQLMSHLYTVYLPPVCKLPRLSPGLVDTVTWLYTPLLITKKKDYLYCIVHYCVCQISWGIYCTGQLVIFRALYIYSLSLIVLLDCHFLGLFLKTLKYRLMHGKYKIMHAWQKILKILCILEAPRIQLWMTNLEKQS